MTDFPQLETVLTRVVRSANLLRLHDYIAAESGIELDRAAYGTLGTLDDVPGARLSEIANRLGIDISTASRHVQGLEQQGFVRREADPRDRRAASLELTEEGRQVYERIKAARCEVLKRVLGSWSEADLQGLERLLARLADDLGAFLAVPPPR